MNTYDAVVAGGGLIGASIAFELAETGLKVALYDAREPGQEASWASAGMISPAPENPGMIPFMPMGLASAALYPEFIRKVEELTGQDSGYQKSGALDVILDDDLQKAQEELSTIVALQRGVGLHAEAISAERAREMEPALNEDTQAAIFRADESSLDARAFTQAVLQGARQRGVEIFAGNGAKALKKEGSRCCGLVLGSGQVEAKWTVVAAGCFSARIAGAEPYAPVSPAKGQMAALRCEAVEIKHILWLGHKYLVPRKDGRIIAGSTIEQTGFNRHVTAGGIQAILGEAMKMVPALQDARIEETWAGLRPDSPDHLPIIGPTDIEGLLIATGHFRSGILLAPITARLIQEWVTTQQVSVDWARVSPMRFLEAKEKKVVSFRS
jgi:glycine oxidase